MLPERVRHTLLVLSTLDLGIRSNSVLPCSFPMSTTERGCWSCQARRKRCEGSTPRCNTCDWLGIDCAGFGTSPSIWMDGGVQQRAYCGWLQKRREVGAAIQSQQQRCFTGTTIAAVVRLTNESRRDSAISGSDPLDRPRPILLVTKGGSAHRVLACRVFGLRDKHRAVLPWFG